MLIIRHIRQLITCAGAAPRRGRGAARCSDRRSTVPRSPPTASGSLFAGPDADLPGVARRPPDAAHHRRPRRLGGPGLRRRPHPRDVRGRSARRAAPPARRRDLRRDRRRRAAASSRRSRATRAATRGRARRRARAPRLVEMLACGTTTAEIKSGYGLDVETELKMLRAIRTPRRRRSRSTSCRPSWARTRFPSTIASRARGLRPPRHRRDDPGGRGGRAGRVVRRVLRDRRVHAGRVDARFSQAGAARGLKPRIHADELGASGGSQVAADVGARSADHLIFVPEEGIRALARRRRRRDAAAQRGVLSEARAVRAGARADRRGRAGRARHRRQPRRRILAVDALRDDARLLRDGAHVRGSRSSPRRSTAPTRSTEPTSVGSLEPGKLMDAVLVAGDAIDLIRVGAPSIAVVIKEADRHRVPRMHHEADRSHRRRPAGGVSVAGSHAGRRLGVSARGRGRRVAADHGRRPAEAASRDRGRSSNGWQRRDAAARRCRRIWRR